MAETKKVTLQEAVQKFAADLAQKINSFVTDISELEVRTYTTPANQVETFVKGQADFAEILTEGKLVLRAYTKIAFDGDTTACIPTEVSGEVDEEVWGLHQSTVRQAMTHRTLMIESIGKAAASALAALKEVGE